jgi:hypothetical protein
MDSRTSSVCWGDGERNESAGSLKPLHAGREHANKMPATAATTSSATAIKNPQFRTVAARRSISDFLIDPKILQVRFEHEVERIAEQRREPIRVSMVMFAIIRAIAIHRRTAWTARTTNRPSNSGPRSDRQGQGGSPAGGETEGLGADWYRAVHDVRQVRDPRVADRQAFTATVEFTRI